MSETAYRRIQDLPSTHLLGTGTAMCAGCGGLHAFRTGVNSLTFSGDGSSFAYQARNAHEKWRLVLDGKEYAGIKDDYHFSPAGGTIAAATCEGKQGCCWRTGKDVGKPRAEGEACPTLVEFAGDGKAVVRGVS